MPKFPVLVAIAAFLALFGASSAAFASATIATVNGTRISDEDLTRRLQEEQGSANVSQDIRLQTLQHLMAEVAVDAAFGKAVKSDPNLQAALELQRRKFVLAAYDSSRLQGIEVSQGEIDAFIAAHPDFFAGRRTWHYSRVDLTALTPIARNEMTSRLPDLRKMSGMSPDDVQLALIWAQNPAYQLRSSRAWEGSEQVAPDDLVALKQMEGGPDKVRVRCNGPQCHVLVLHASYPDPVDAAMVRPALAAQLRRVKSAQVIEKANADLLAHADIKVDDAALAAAMARTTSSLAQDEHATRRRLIWTAQILNVLGALACGLLILRKEEDKYRRASYLVVVSYERYVRMTAAILLPLGIAFLGLFVLSGNPFVKPAIDAPVVAGLTLCSAGLAALAWRHARGLRQVMRRRRYGLLMLLGVEAALLTTLA